MRETAVGVEVIERLERPGVDKSAEIRRLAELGYAAERAGFVLDGTELRHGDRAWPIQPKMARGTIAPPFASATPRGNTVSESSCSAPAAALGATAASTVPPPNSTVPDATSTANTQGSMLSLGSQVGDSDAGKPSVNLIENLRGLSSRGARRKP
jgi:hypothetical protein